MVKKILDWTEEKREENDSLWTVLWTGFIDGFVDGTFIFYWLIVICGIVNRFKNK